MRVMLSEAKHPTYGDWITLKTKNVLRICVRYLPSYLMDQLAGVISSAYK
jgi:hypothetical protein